MTPMSSFSRLREDSNKIGIDFLLTELDTAFTFLSVADTTSSSETRDRNRRNAFDAYRTVLRMRPRVVMGSPQKVEFQDKVSDLKRRLEDLGFEL